MGVGMTKASEDGDSYSESETARRRDAIVRNMIATPPTPHKPSKKKKATRPRAKSAKPKKRVPSA
jgi:hypothetical protein